MNDFTTELTKLHTLAGAEFIQQVEKIAMRKEFHPLVTDENIFTVGGEGSDDYQNLLMAARKAVDLGYKVYILPNPRDIRTPDFILVKRGLYNTRSLAFAIKRYFEANEKAVEVLIFKGRKRISVDRSMASQGGFVLKFKHFYER